MNGQPLSPDPRKASRYSCHRDVCPSNVTTLHPGELLTLRILVDRPIVVRPQSPPRCAFR
jgi:hypothetical protein